MADRLDPARATYAFANRFVNVVLRVPHAPPVRTAGRCGGMAYSVLDHAVAGRDVPAWPPALFAPGRVPPDGHLVADHLAARQLDSFRSASALRFLLWSALPDGDVGPVAGVRTRTRRELPGVLRALAEGRPVVLGLVVARHVLRSGDNHQVVATAATRGADGVTLTVLDPNAPRREVTLTETPDGWRASDGRRWRGFFRHAYAPRTPPPLPSASRRPAARVRAGSAVGLLHVASGRLLVAAHGRPALRAAGTTTWGLTSRDDGTWVLTASGAGPGGCLGLAGGTPVLGDDDAWRVVVDGDGPWREGARVRLVHARTGALLTGAGGVLAATFDPDPATWWTVAG